MSHYPRIIERRGVALNDRGSVVGRGGKGAAPSAHEWLREQCGGAGGEQQLTTAQARMTGGRKKWPADFRTHATGSLVTGETIDWGADHAAIEV
jgi:hypothetical protein